MLNAESWKPTKFARDGHGRWRGSRDRRELGVGSRISADMLAAAYAAAIGKFARGHLVDLGCGKVPLFDMYRDRTTQVTCVDWPNSLHETSHIDEYADLNKPLPFADAAFDTILSSDVLEHIWKHQMLWAEMSRILAPGGHLILGTPFLYWVHEAPHDYFRWTPFSLRQACADVGLEVVELSPVGGALEVLGDIATKLIATKSGRMAAAASAVIARAVKLGPLRRLSEKTSSRFTLSHILVARKP